MQKLTGTIGTSRKLEPSGNRIFAAPDAGQTKPAELVSAHIARRIVAKRTLRDFREIAAAVRQLDRLPGRDESIHAIMRGDFHGWDLVPAVLKLAAPESIEELTVATLGFNMANATELLQLVDAGQIARVLFVCSHYFQKSNPREFEALRGGLTDRGHRIVAVRSHAKILGMRLSGGRCVVVESSANLRSCRNIEQFCMTESPALYEFHRRWIAEVIECRSESRKSPSKPVSPQ